MQTTTDVIVIGGGVLGAATVFELADRGIKAVLLEREMPNRQGSGTTAGNLHIQAIHSERPDQAVAVDTAALVPAQAESAGLWRELEQRLGRDVGVAINGGITVAETEAQVARLNEKHAWEAAAGIPTEVIDGAAARELVPHLGDSVLAATWCPWDGWANNLLIAPTYLARAEALGATIMRHSPAVAIERLENTWRVSTPGDVFEAPAVVNVAGPWLDQVSALAGYRLQLTPLAIQMLQTVRVAPQLRHLVQHIGEGFSVKQVSDGSLVIGGGWPAADFNLGGISSVAAASVDGNMAQVRRLLPGLGGISMVRAWTGPLAATPDEMPIVGEMPDGQGMFIAGGTYAFTFSPLWARTLVDLITQTQPLTDVSAFAPARLLETISQGA